MMQSTEWPYHAHAESDAHMFLGCLFLKSFWRQFAISCHCIVHMYETQMQSLKRCKMCHQNAQLSAILCIDWHILKAGN
jgi:hypothetical protein